MKIRSVNLRRVRTDSRHGFSLVEVLLTLVLILCLAAASVFTFTAIYRSANLDEGYDRFQSLIRFAQAEAATTGRKVRLQFEPVATNNAAADEKSELRNIKVTWEADLLNNPGVFQDYTNKSWSEDIVNELVGVEKVQPIQSPAVPSTPADQIAPMVDPTSPSGLAADSADSTDSTGLAAATGSPVTSADTTSDFPSITFYPDGSCDSAEIVLASRNPEDDRRVAVRLSGILGSVSSRTLTPSDTGDLEEDPFDEFSDSSMDDVSSQDPPAEPVTTAANESAFVN